MSEPRVLLVDDDLALNFASCEALRDGGFHVVSASRVADALRLISEPVKLLALVTDVDLRCDQDGFDVARHARLNHPDVPVIFISGAAAARHSENGVDRSEFIPKPFHLQQVVDVLRRMVEPSE